uniref:Uncharacterized protein n=1 Tax=Rhizophora mucronata TaxID=61149 RepID=A0A2P2P275_RHIMU
MCVCVGSHGCCTDRRQFWKVMRLTTLQTICSRLSHLSLVIRNK